MPGKRNDIPGTSIKVIGFGNIFMSDDGLGIKAIEQLRQKKVAAEIIDGGTSAADLILQAKNAQKIIIIDAVDAGQHIGEIIRFHARDIEKFGHALKSFSLHDFNLCQALAIIKKLKIKVDMVIVGIKPKHIGFGQGLSPEIEKKIPQIVDMVIKEIDSCA